MTFPCPTCARLIAEAGFRRCYFAGPYSVLEGENVLQAAGIEVFWVDVEEAEPTTDVDAEVRETEFMRAGAS